VSDQDPVRSRLRSQAQAGNLRVTQHAQQEMAEEEFTLDDALHVIMNGEVLENYPEHRRGACCLLNGRTRAGRPLHVVCSTATPKVIIVTVYEPRAPKWETPTQRGRSR